MPFRTIVTLCALVFLYGTCIGDSNWTSLRGTTTLSGYSAAVFLTSQRAVFGTTSGEIFRTEDRGLTWSLKKTDTNEAIQTLIRVDSNSLYALQGRNRFLKSTDGGLSWITHLNTSGCNLWKLDFLDKDTGYAVGSIGYGANAKGCIVKTMDGGLQWTVKSSGTIGALWEVVQTDSRIIYAFGAQGTVLKTINGGDSWRYIPTGFAMDIKSAYFTTPSTGFTVGSAGLILKTLDSGATWSSQNVGNSESFNCVLFTTAKNGFVVGSSGSIFTTQDAGVTWDSPKAAFGNVLFSIHFWDALLGYTLGDTGMLLQTVDGGKSWAQINEPIRTHLNAVHFINKDTGIVAGANGQIYKTWSGGLKWSKIASGTTVNLTSTYFTSSQVGFIAGYDGLILKTKDAGDTWKGVPNVVHTALRSLWFTDSLTGFCVGDGSTILKTMDAGESWIIQSADGPNDIRSVQFLSPSIGFAVGIMPQIRIVRENYSRGIVLRTRNGGSTWETVNSYDYFNGPLQSLLFINANSGFVFGPGGRNWKTQDGGDSWQLVNPTKLSGTVNDAQYSDAQSGYLLTKAGILKTDNSGESWVLESPSGEPGLWALHFPEPHTGYAVGNNGSIWKNTNTNAVDLLLQKPKSKKARLSSKSGRVQFRLEERSPISLTMKNLKGETVVTLFDRVLTSGHYEISIPAFVVPGEYLFILKSSKGIESLMVRWSN
jgi:photosystem II stability/assembly factor-like uncharacterized protein